MNAADVARPVLAGHRRVDALWFPDAWFDEAARRRHVLDHWRPGSAAWRFADGDLLRLAAPAIVDCATLAGWPLQRFGDGLCSADLAASELEGRPHADVWLVVGGVLAGRRFADAAPLDPSLWVALEGVAFVDTYEARLAPARREFAGVAPARALHEVLGSHLPAAPSAAAAAFARAVAGGGNGKQARAAAPTHTKAAGSSKGPRLGSGVSLIPVVAIGVSLLHAAFDKPSPPPAPVVLPPPMQLRVDPATGRVEPDWRPAPRQTARSTTPPSSPTFASPRADATSPFGEVSADPSIGLPLSPSLPGTSSSHDAGEARIGAPPPAAPAPVAAQAPAPRPIPTPPEQDDNSSPVIPIAIALALGTLIVFALRKRGAARIVSPAAAARAAKSASRPANAAPAQGSAGAAAAPVLPPRLDRVLPQRWRAWLARLAMTSGLGQLLGRQHAAYLRRMLALFDEGRIEEALRHAIPLGVGPGSLGQKLGLLGPRKDLSLAGRPGAAPSIGIGAELQQHLRALYRQTFERLDRAGRVDEAVFVLAELLSARREALDYLEKKERTAQAAELSLRWDMPAAQIVRLYALAGDWRQAFRVAQRDNAFAAAIVALEPRWMDAAARLRREWARLLAARGDWLAAVRAVWRIPSERAEALQWLALCEAAGGTLGARALALRAQCDPEALASRAERVRALCDERALAPERAALARELVELEAPVSQAARHLAAALAGALLADHAAPDALLDAHAVRRAIELAADPALLADLPEAALTDPSRPPLLARTVAVELDAPEPGLHGIFDAVPLADGEFLVALGEAGLLRIDRRGRRLARFEVPGHRIVISHEGRSALALARREQTWRVARLDLARSRATDLGQVAPSAFADRYDGVGWTIAEGTRVHVLDTTGDRLGEVLWHVADLPHPVVAIDADRAGERWILASQDPARPALQQWRYMLPARRLIARDELAHEPPGPPVSRLLAHGFGLLDVAGGPDDSRLVRVRSSLLTGAPWIELPRPTPPSSFMFASGALIAVRCAAKGQEGSGDEPIHVHDLRQGILRASLRWPAAAAVRIRSVDQSWLVFDADGRLVVLDVATGAARVLRMS